jgi:hypothetical protein
MIGWRLVVPIVLVAAAAAGCFTYFMSELGYVEANYQSPSASHNPSAQDGVATKKIDQRLSDEEKAIADFHQAAEAILRRSPDARASATGDEPPIAGKIPLPRRRPIARP